MIVFDRLWKTMKDRKMTTYMLRDDDVIDSQTVRRLKANKNMETKTLNKLCAVLHCKLEDIAEYVEDPVTTAMIKKAKSKTKKSSK